MAYIFLDESGDLGFNFKKKKTTKYFVITLLFSKEKRPLKKIIKRIFNSFTKKEIKNHHGSLHCYKEHPKTRIRLLTQLKKKDISIISVYLNKKKVYVDLQGSKHVLYNYVANIVLDRVYSKKLIPINDAIFLIASRRETNKFLNINFKTYLKNKIDKNHKLKINIEIRNPTEERALQVVDFVSWSIFRKIEHQDDSYSNIFASKVVEISRLFP